ncbi:glycosyl hydrolase [Aquimarina sp. BL5]|uniref:glycoside hydrolase family 117 protein n=1 Tax=Aquimarina sp. BL5 TaxID=1714860 RepID=UPI000E47258C|nr:family 43 glycosylhydrolase [Aquimarina sp. BL5]AXT53518.1 glycosyl hydrolase [Aquimarina sp. BL5]RKM92776.1 glycosyl hydrolase [Aquimarina sp. BL5]
MKLEFKKIVLFFLIGIIASCGETIRKEELSVEKEFPCQPLLDLSQEKLDRFGITNKEYLSAASKRALQWPYVENDWFRLFNKLQPLKGDLAYEKGVVRRDPSAIIKENGKYYVWYSKSVGKSQGFGGDIEKDKVFPWDRCDIWYATSDDGWTWKEEGIAVPRGEKGAYDDRSVFTVEIMKHDTMYYLCYQTVKSPYNVRVKNQVGLAWSSSPDGPWEKSKEPILKPADNGIWKGKEQNRFLVNKKGDFDSHKVHDPCILPFKGKFYLYYKGEQMGEEILFGGRQIRHGVAIADNPKGPYVKSKYNPISNSGHEICVWPTQGGIASLITTDGPERNTIQWAPDGINFEIRAAVQTYTTPPHAIGLNRTIEVPDNNPTKIFDWGLSHMYNNSDEQSIMRFSSYMKKFHVAKGVKKSK